MRLLVRMIPMVVVVGGAQVAAADDGLGDLLGPREIAVGEAMRGGATGSAAIGLNPAGLPLNRELVFEGGYGYRGSDAASLIGASACDSTNAVPGCFFYQHVGASPELDGMTGSRRSHVAGIALSRLIVPRVFVGATVKYFDFNSDMMGDQQASGWAFDTGATVRLTEMVNLGVSAQNLARTSTTTQFPRAIGGGLQARPLAALALGFDMRWKLDGAKTARYGGGAELFVRTSGGRLGIPLRAGAVHDNGTGATYISGGLGLASLRVGLDVAARRQVAAGEETMVIASLRFFGPREAMPAIDE
jgi:hypothetical protein